jgi:hypothetical protein
MAKRKITSITPLTARVLFETEARVDAPGRFTVKRSRYVRKYYSHDLN